LLREFYKRAMGMPTTKREPATQLRESVEPTSKVVTNPSESAQPISSGEETQKAASLVVTGGTEEEKILSLKQQASNWAPAKALGGFRQTMVFSTGNPRADILLVGEAPGFDEERFQEPFVGKAGQKLDAILRAMGTERDSVYLTNIVKFRPGMPNQTTSNRKPTPEELGIWLPFIREEVMTVAPKVIIALGGTAAQALMESQKSVTEMRGKFHHYEGIPLCVTYHPSYILHDEATAEKRMLWEDMLGVMKLLDMPISDKQRGYFTKKS